MSKFRIDSKDSTLNPYQTEDQLSGRDKMVVQPRDPYLKVSNPFYENLSTLEVDPTQSLYGNSSYAEQVINEGKAYRQGTLELAAKGLGNVVKTIGLEIGKTPGYIGGLVGAIGNEVIGDGKQSMNLIVDNAWINAFESLDESAKEMMPVYLSQQVQEGNLLDKMGSGAWWATTGADGLGFMLSMFAPGAAAKALKVGSGIARVGEGLGNLAPKLGKWATGKGLLESVGEGFAYTQKFARNADGYAATVLNTAIESSAEAANTFDNLKSKFVNQGLSEEEASLKAGEGAAAVFKGNMALLAVSNYLDELWIWKTIGSAGEKEAAKSILSRVMKDGIVDVDALKRIPKELGRASVLKKVAGNFGKNILKEGAYEEGSQTTLQQNVEEGTEGFIKDMANIATSYFDDFANNSELHESIFLGGLLGGGASIIGTVQENRALRGSLMGSKGRSADNFWVKYGILPQTNPQKGLLNLVNENHIKQFRSYKDFLDVEADGSFKLNEQKLADANLEQVDNLRTNALYDVAVATGDKLGQEIYGQFLASNYAQTFLGQEGGQEIFNEHAQNQVLPAWQKRFEDSFGRPATSKESQDYLTSFKNSSERVFKAHNTAQSTNYPERYYKENSPDYEDFRREYFHKKFETLVTLDSVNERRSQINRDLAEAQVTTLDLEDVKQIKDPVKRQLAEQIKDELEQIDKYEEMLQDHYPKFFTKVGVKEMYESFKARKELFSKVSEEALKENEELKLEIDAIPSRNETELARLQTLDNGLNSMFKGVDGKRYSLQDLQNSKEDITNLGLQLDDVSKEEFENFTNTGTASQAVLKRIAKRLLNKEQLSDKEKAIAAANSDQLKAIFEDEATKVKEQLAGQEPQSKSDESEDVNSDEAVDSVYKKKGVNLYPSTGRNLEDELVEVGEKPFEVLAEKMTSKSSQKLWFDTLDNEVKNNPTAYTVQVVRLDNKTNPELHQQLLRDSNPADRNDSDLYTVLYKDGKPVVKEGNYVFTGLWRPSALYPVKDGRPTKFILAESAILNNFLLHVKMPKLDIKKVSKSQQDLLKTFGVTDFTEEGIMTAAFFHAKEEYTKWYQSLQNNPGQLQVAGITKGHSVKTYNKGKTIKWNDMRDSIPGLTLVDDKLVGGKFEMSVTGVIKVDNEEFSIPVGDVVLVDAENNVHPTRARNIQEFEARTILYLLSLRSNPGPTEAIKVKPPKPAIFGNLQLKEVPVFFNEKNPRATLIESMISFGSKKGKAGAKGEIYFNKDSIATNPLLVWTDFDGNTQNMEVSIIKEAVDSNDFSKVQSLLDFLSKKRFNVNEQLLSAGQNMFSRPQLEYTRDTDGKIQPELQWTQDESYNEVLLGDVLSTTTSSLEGYPNRVQRNLFFNKQPIQEEVVEFSDLVWEEAAVEEPVVETPKPNRRRAKASLDEFREDADEQTERSKAVETVDKVIEAEVTLEEIVQIATEENISPSEVKEKVKEEVVRQMNSSVQPKTLLQKVAARIKKILLSIFLVGSMLHISSFTFAPSSANLAYDNLKVGNLQSFDNVYLDQDAINKKDNINIITTSQKNNEDSYIIVDKKIGMVHIFKGENLISSAEVGVGENVSDDQTVIKSLFFNSRGKEVSANEAIMVSNGNSFLKDGYSSRINWDDGNKSTGAGIYTIARKGDYHGSTGYFLKNERGISVPMALHKVTNATRARKISDGNPNNNRVSNGCVNFNLADIESLSNKGVKEGTKIFVLPDNPNNKYSIIDGKLRFISNQSTVNKTVVPYEALPITLKASSINSDGKEYLQALSNNKRQLMKLYPSVSNDIYNQITKIAYGIFGQESSYGTFGGVRGKYGFVKDEVATALTDKDVSVGVTQIRFSSVNSKTRNAFNITSATDLKNSVVKSAIATMSLLLDMYESQIPGNLKSDFKELLPLGYSNRTEFSKGIKGDNTVYNNKYVTNVISNGSNVSVYLGSSEIPQVTKSELARIKESGTADKILTTNDLLKSKIQSGEIIQKCK